MRVCLVLTLFVALACSGSTAPSVARPVAAGSLVGTTLIASYDVVLPETADQDAALAEAKRRSAAVSISPRQVPAAELVPVDRLLVAPGWLERFGEGLSADDIAAIGRSRHAIEIVIPSDRASRRDREHAAAAIAAGLASDLQGYIYDPWTQQTFSAASFAARRPGDGPEEVEALVVLHVVREDAGDSRLIDTSGLARFGLPELVLHGVPPLYVPAMQALVSATAQTLIENDGPTERGALHVSLAALRTPPWTDRAAETRSAGGTGEITVGLGWTPENEVEIVLPGHGNAEARVYAAVPFVGPPELPEIKAAAGDPELEAARKRAMDRLTALAGHFANGVPERENLMVKAPFQVANGGVEWMWVQVVVWSGSEMSGILMNEPFAPASFHAGDRVNVRFSDLADYMWVKADGTEEGGESNTILERRQREGG